MVWNGRASELFCCFSLKRCPPALCVQVLTLVALTECKEGRRWCIPRVMVHLGGQLTKSEIVPPLLTKFHEFPQVVIFHFNTVDNWKKSGLNPQCVGSVTLILQTLSSIKKDTVDGTSHHPYHASH